MDHYEEPVAPRFSSKFVSECLGLSPNYVRNLEEDLQIEIERVARGSAEVRSYSIENIFEIQGKRREKGMIKGLHAPMTICTYVKKGGTAKTSISVNLAIQLQLLGLRVLVIDNDPQGDATTMFGYDPDRTVDELQEEGMPSNLAVDGHFGHLIAPSNSRMVQKRLDQVIKMPYGPYGPHLIPAEQSLDDLSTVLASMMHSDMRYGIFIEKARNGEIPGCDLSPYDVILFDNNPASTPLSRNAMVSCDMLLCPIRFDKFSFRALDRLSEMLNEFAEATGRSPAMVAIPTMYVKQRPRMQRNLAALTELFPESVTQTQLNQSEDYAKSLEDGINLSFYREASATTLSSIKTVAQEIADRLRILDGSLS